MNKSIFILWGNCFLIKGYFFSVVVDLQKEKYLRVPNFYIIDFENEKFKINIQSEIKNLGYGFYTEYPNKFQKINLKRDYPYDISILELVIDSEYFEMVDFQIFKNIRIECLSLVFKKKETNLTFNNLKKLLNIFNFESIQLVIKYQETDFQGIINNLNINEIISKIYCNSIINNEIYNGIEFLNLNKAENYLNMFVTNLPVFIESSNHNVYYNQKITIFTSGFYLNFKSNKLQLKDTNTKKIISNIKSIWNSNKEITDICKDCEFRKICIDKRFPFKRNQNHWYHKQECNYNPYICKWKGEDGYRSLAESGVISNEHEFSIDHNKIAEINKELWEEE